MRLAPLQANLIRNCRRATPHYPTGTTVRKIGNSSRINFSDLMDLTITTDIYYEYYQYIFACEAVMGGGSAALPGQADLAAVEVSIV